MSPVPAHFAAFSFVDRIVLLEPGKRARGVFTIPAGIRAFPSALIAEAVGQLAAWVAMDRIDFRGRPVAALATETIFHGDAVPGNVLDLEVEILECDDAAVAYNGRASIDGRAAIELVDCLGPMLPVTDFDAPETLRNRLALLRSEGAPPGRFTGVDDPAVTIIARTLGASLRATLDVPAFAPFFADHFPRWPVFPATLLLDAKMRLALGLARESPAMQCREPVPLRVTHVKMRSFIAPSQRLDIGIELATPRNAVALAKMTASTNGRTVATSRLEIAIPDVAP